MCGMCGMCENTGTNWYVRDYRRYDIPIRDVARRLALHWAKAGGERGKNWRRMRKEKKLVVCVFVRVCACVRESMCMHIYTQMHIYRSL